MNLILAARSSRVARVAKRPAVSSLRAINGATRRFASFTHALQHYVEWGIPPVPEWYDHHLDVQWRWPRHGGSLFLERGVFGSLAMEPGATVLELCCGDGFNARHLYAHRAGRVVAVDFDRQAIDHARRRNSHPAVEYVYADIRDNMPSGRFTNVMLDAAIEHFTETEIDALLRQIDERLTDDGVLSGYTLIAADAGKHLVHHEREFSGKDDLMRFLACRFPHAAVFETVHPTRTNLYFYAARDAARIPFGAQHQRFLWHHASALSVEDPQGRV